MKFGLSLPPIGPYSDPVYLSEIAVTAEQAGWDGFFIWDHCLYFSPYEPLVPMHPIVDPWIALAAIAVNTERVRLGPMITSLARRRPWKVARETVSLDLLSHGRFIMGVGLGAPADLDFGSFGEEENDKLRARKMDEGLDILNGLWTGGTFRFQGEFYSIRDVQFLPRPVQQPRIPIWIGGNWDNPAAARRAARWDGFFPAKWRGLISVDEWHVIIDRLKQHRADMGSMDLVQGGETPGGNPTRAREIVAPFDEMGLTWWIEHIDPWRFGMPWGEFVMPDAHQKMNERILQGPPKL